MSVVCEIAFARPQGGGRGSAHFSDDWLRHFARLPALTSLDLYVPAAGAPHDPYVNDGPAPALLVLAFPSLEDLDRASRDPAFEAGLAAVDAVSCTAMRRIAFPIGGGEPALAALFSYVVRYHRPAEDEALFVKNYLETHPTLLARLPGIREVMCYLPLPWRHAGDMLAADYMLGNEVAFDDVEAFNAAMNSLIRRELRAHYRRFPPFSGRNTHFAMERKRLVGRGLHVK